MMNPSQSVPEPDNPKFGTTWLDDGTDEILAWDGREWVPYEDMPAWPGSRDPDPKALDRDA